MMLTAAQTMRFSRALLAAFLASWSGIGCAHSAKSVSFKFVQPATAAVAAPAAAQNDSDRWVERCRRNNGDSDRETHCEVRAARFPARGSLRGDAGQNGGVTVRAWDGRDGLVRDRDAHRRGW
jgi:hypothetical protein